jgi:hypothetical protein
MTKADLGARADHRSTFRCPCGYVAYDDEPLEHETLSCCNCGGVKCIGCVTRVYDHDCVHDCPDCRPGR